MQLKSLGTERRNPRTMDLDRMTSLEFVTAMNREDAVVPRAIRPVLPQIAEAVDMVARQLGRGGRLIYVGSGTSGRIGALDASECPPTFGTDPEQVQFMMAGGEKALVSATEASEDSAALGTADMAARKPGKRDVIVGLAASGRTPYTIAAVAYARSKGAATIAVSCNRNAPLSAAAALSIEVNVGPEALTGSTRLKAGTAQKLICNMLTTGAMTQLGYVYGNLMVNMQLKNEKLVERGISILQTLTGADCETASAALQAANMSVPVALVILQTGLSQAKAEQKLRKAGGRVRKALES